MGLREQQSSGLFQADRQNDLLSASIGTPDHPGRLRGHSSAYTKVKDVYGKGARKRRAQQSEQDERIRQLEREQQETRAMMARLVSMLSPDQQQEVGLAPTAPSSFPTQVSSNQYADHPPPIVDEVTRCLELC